MIPDLSLPPCTTEYSSPQYQYLEVFYFVMLGLELVLEVLFL